MASRARPLTRRQRAALPGSGYDRMVGVVKWLLPLLASVIFAACLILPLTKSGEFSFILSKDRVAPAGERLRVERAAYRGEDSKGQPFTITAASAVQRTSATPVVELNDIAATLQAQDGPVRATAERGRYDLERETIAVDGPVRVDSAAGYLVETRDVRVDLPSRSVASDDGVSGRVPLGTFSAQRLRADVNDRTVVLEGRARLRIVQRRP
jgi:lipopolysaccharide export system protein LptC